MLATPRRLQKIHQAQEQDSICQQLMLFAEKDGLIKKVTLCKPNSVELSVQSRLPLSGSHIVIPTDLQKAILEKLHTEHLGITKCQERVKQCVW